MLTLAKKNGLSFYDEEEEPPCFHEGKDESLKPRPKHQRNAYGEKPKDETEVLNKFCENGHVLESVNYKKWCEKEDLKAIKMNCGSCKTEIDEDDHHYFCPEMDGLHLHL